MEQEKLHDVCLKLLAIYQEFAPIVELCQVIINMTNGKFDDREARFVSELRTFALLIIKLLEDCRKSAQPTVNLVDLKARHKKFQNVMLKLSKNTRMALSMVNGVYQSAITLYDDFLKSANAFHAFEGAKSENLETAVKEIALSKKLL